MSELNYFRLIEDYFNGVISTENKLMLESQLEKDPLLKAEFNLQRNIKEGLSIARKQQLKQRLSAIDMAPISVSIIQSSAVKWLTATVTAATILGGVLFYFSGDNNPIIPLDIKQLQANNFNDESSLIDIPTLIINPAPEITKKDINSPSEKIIRKLEPTDKNIVEDNSEGTQVKDIAIKPQSLLSFEDESLFAQDESNDLDKINPVSIKLAPAKNTNIEILKSIAFDKYHYRYYNNKLYLYGDFNEEPYEIIELKQKGDRRLYLSYKETVYIIEANVTEITALRELENEKLLNELKIISASN